MKIGDLVEVATRDGHVGVIVNMWRNHNGRVRAADVLLEDGKIKYFGAHAMRGIDESR